MPNCRCAQCGETRTMTIIGQADDKNTFGLRCIVCSRACSYCYCDRSGVYSGELQGCDHCRREPIAPPH